MNIFNTHYINLQGRNLQSEAKVKTGIQQKLIAIFMRVYFK